MANEFQNGLAVGLTLRGVLTAKDAYTPAIHNDTGVYTFFYIDFLQPLTPFTLAMLQESITVTGSGDVKLPISKFIKTDPRRYKIYVDLSGQKYGVTVANKKTTVLHFETGGLVTPFTVQFYVQGITSYIKPDYIYEEVTPPQQQKPTNTTESYSIVLPAPTTIGYAENITVLDKTKHTTANLTITENATVILR